MRKVYDTHHIVPTSKGGSQSRNNKGRLDIRKHRALHMLFDNGSPVEQIARIMSINMTALTDDFRHDVNEILKDAKDPQYVYRNGILIPL